MRVIDRSGGFSDIWASTSVQLTDTVTEATLQNLLNDLQTHYTTYRDWQHLLSHLIGVAVEISSTPSISSSLRRDAISLFLDVFSEDLPATPTHYQLAAQLLSLLTSNTDLTTLDSNTETIAAALTTIGSFFRSQSTITPATTLSVAGGDGDEPLQLIPVEGVAPPSAHLPVSTATNLLVAWSNIVTFPDTPTDLIATSAVAVQDIGVSLCQEMVYGELPSLATSSIIELLSYKTPPTGRVNIRGDLLELGDSVEQAFIDQACPYDHQTCYETCLLGVRYSSDLFSEDFLQLSSVAAETITSTIEGADPESIKLVSSVLSVSVSIPARNGFLRVDDLEQDFVVLFLVGEHELVNGSVPLCLFREIGGGHGFSTHLWEIESTSPPSLVTIDSVNYYQCSFSHLTEFAVGLLPPPTIPPPPSPTPTPIPSHLPSSSTIPTLTPSPVPPTDPKPRTGISPAVIIIPLLLVTLIVVTAVCVVIIFLVWKKKRMKVLKIAPDEGPSGVEVTDGGPKRTRTGPLTPEESKVPMPIIELQEGGKRAVVGSMNVLPSIRLRELRYHLHDQFPGFKGKPFYFLTRQLVDIELPTEQQQFVSLVYGDEPDKPVFVRRVETASELTRLHFCVCGNAAQFECSSCSAQGYCSPECQTSDWVERHQRECGRLGERKQRMSILRQQVSNSALSPVDEQNRLPSIFPERQNVSATTPLDFRSLLHSQRSFQRMSFASPSTLEPSVATPSFTSPTKPPLPPLTTPRRPSLPPLTTPTRPTLTTPRSARTTLSMLAGQTHPPTIEEESEGEDGEENGGHSLQTSTYRPPAHRRLPPLSTTPARPSLASPRAHFTPAHFHTASPPHSTPIPTHSSRLFQRLDPALRPPPLQPPPTNPQQQQQQEMDSRKISIRSLGGPVEYSLTSPRSQQSLRKQARLRPQVEESSSSESESDGGSTRQTSPATHSHSVSEKKRATSKRDESSSSSGSEEDSGEESSDTQPSTPLVTDKP